MAGLQTSSMNNSPLAVAPNLCLLQPIIPTHISARLTFESLKITKPTSDSLSSTIDNQNQQLSFLSNPLHYQYPINLLTNKSMFAGEICPSCSKIYSSKRDLQDHLIVHHERKFECERCTRTFVSEKRMRAHELKKHSELASEITKGSGERKLFQCNQCDRAYETLYNFKEHVAKHEGKLFRCTTCNKHLSGQSALSRHSKIHEKPHECMMCTSRFSSAYDLDCHFSYYHSTVKRFKCFYCNRVLYNYSGKLRHERLCILKRPVTEKQLCSTTSITPTMVPNSEEFIQTVRKCGTLIETNENCTINQNPFISKTISDAKSNMYRISRHVGSHCSLGTKSQRPKTFRICDIMYDVPGFSQ